MLRRSVNPSRRFWASPPKVRAATTVAQAGGSAASRGIEWLKWALAVIALSMGCSEPTPAGQAPADADSTGFGSLPGLTDAKVRVPDGGNSAKADAATEVGPDGVVTFDSAKPELPDSQPDAPLVDLPQDIDQDGTNDVAKDVGQDGAPEVPTDSLADSAPDTKGDLTLDTGQPTDLDTADADEAEPDELPSVADSVGEFAEAVEGEASLDSEPDSAQDSAPDIIAETITETAPPADIGEVSGPVVRFAAFGDAGKGNAGQLAIGKAVANYCKTAGCDFVLLLGDNFYDTGVSGPNDSQFKTKFEDPYQEVDEVFYVVLGNHDYGGNGAGSELQKGAYYVQYSQKNPKFWHPANTWNKQIGAVHLFGLDSNLQMYGLGSEQVKVFGPLIANSQATWKIALAHHPYLSNGPHGNAGVYEGLPGVPIVSGDGVKQTVDALLCNKVDLYLSGHDHSSQWLQQKSGCAMELIVAGAGASTTEIKKQSLLYTPNKAYFQDAEHLAFLWVEIQGKTLVGRFIDSSGATLFERKVTKP